MTKNGAPKFISGPAAFADAFKVSRETLERLEVFENLLRRWQKTINLVAPSTLDSIWHRHFADSAQLAGLALENWASWVDFGSGAGFPGLVVAILAAEDGENNLRQPVILVESDHRKCAFLREVARQTAVAVDIVTERIEAASFQDRLDRISVISARALAPLVDLLALSAPHAGADSVLLFPKGRNFERELDAARSQWSFSCVEVPSVTESGAVIAVITNLNAKTEG